MKTQLPSYVESHAYIFIVWYDGAGFAFRLVCVARMSRFRFKITNLIYQDRWMIKGNTVNLRKAGDGYEVVMVFIPSADISADTSLITISHMTVMTMVSDCLT